MPKMPSHLATLPAFPFLPPPVHPVMSDNNGLNGKENKNIETKKEVKGPVHEGTQEQAEEMDTGQPTSALTANPLLIGTSPPPAERRQSQRIRGQEAKLRCSKKRELKPEEIERRTGKLKTENHTKQIQWRVDKQQHISVP